MSIPLPHTVPPNPTRRRLALPLGAALLSVALFLLPFRLAALGPGSGFASQRALGGAVASGLVRFWSTGAIAPLASVLGLAPVARPGGALGSTTAEVRRTLTAGADTPALDTLLSGFTTYHVAMSWLGAAVTLALLAAAVVIARRRAAVPRAERARRSLVLLTVVATVALAGFFGVVTAANISTAAHPAPALLAFFEGGS
jgi:hypothetical protein